VSCGDFVVDGWMNVDALVVYIPCSYQTIVIKLVCDYARRFEIRLYTLFKLL
jgi:hypothetical protein